MAASRPAAAPATNDNLVLDFDGPGPIWLDDLMLVDNSKALVGEADAQPAFDRWTIERKGFGIIGDADERFRFTFVTAQASPDGWDVREANGMRLWLTSKGKNKNCVIYS